MFISTTDSQTLKRIERMMIVMVNLIAFAVLGYYYKNILYYLVTLVQLFTYGLNRRLLYLNSGRLNFEVLFIILSDTINFIMSVLILGYLIKILQSSSVFLLNPNRTTVNA